MRVRRPRADQGFTLVEVMIAMALLAFMAGSVFTIIRNSGEVQEETRKQVELSQMGRNAMEIMRRELAQAFVSPNQTEYYKTVFKAVDRDPMDEVYFVAKSHEKRYASTKESDLAELHYLSEADREDGAFRTLLHRESAIIDDDPEKGGVTLAMAHSVRELNLRYFDEKKEEWIEEWDSESADFAGRVPRAVEIRLELEDGEGRTQSFLTRTLVYAAAR